MSANRVSFYIDVSGHIARVTWRSVEFVTVYSGGSCYL